VCATAVGRFVGQEWDSQGSGGAMKRWNSSVGLALAVMTLCAAAAAAPRPAPQRPNILFAIADDASWPHMSAYGCRFLKTPNFDRVAREGILFNRCFTPTP